MEWVRRKKKKKSLRKTVVFKCRIVPYMVYINTAEIEMSYIWDKTCVIRFVKELSLPD